MGKLFLLLLVGGVALSTPAPPPRADHNHRDLDWWEQTSFYQIYPRSFMDSNGDGVGDLKGITSKLDHLKDAGIKATWLSPIYKSPMFDFGYDIADFYSIQPEYGTMADFDDLMAKAKELDIKIIMDLVPNHSSSEHEWFLKSLNASSPYANYYIWEDGVIDENGNMGPPNNWVSVFRKSAWTYREERGQYYLHQFAVQQPDLNYRNPAVVEEMKEVIRFWLRKGVAGFRIDAVNFLFEVRKEDFGGKFPSEPKTGKPGAGPDDYDYLDHIYSRDLEETVWMVYEWRKVFDEFKNADNFTRVMMTEVYADIRSVMTYYGNETSEGSHMPFNFGLITDVDGASSARDIKFTTDRWLTYMPLGKTANWVIGNHDQSRVGTRYNPELIDGLNMLVMLLPGTGITYYGEEIGMLNTDISWEDTVDPQACNTDDPINYWKKSRDPARTPFQWDDTKNAGFTSGDKTWLPLSPEYRTKNLASQKAANKSIYKNYQTFIKLRDDHTFLYGEFKSVAFNDAIFAFVRSISNHDSYIVVINMKRETHTVNLNYFPDVAENVLVVVSSMNSAKTPNQSLASKEVTLGPWEALVLRSPMEV